MQELDATSFTVIGGPCSDGLGTEALQLFNEGLMGAQGDFIVVLGGVSPLGRDPFYKTVAGFIDRTSTKPVHVVPGVADGPDFTGYFGPDDRAVLAEDFTLIMLNNAKRSFSDETLTFLRDTLAIAESPNIIVCFQVPPPNRITGDSLSREEWGRFEDAVGVWRKRISLLVCGHVSSYFEDEIDGLRLLVTGGASRVRELERVAAPPRHALEFAVADDGGIRTRVRGLEPVAGSRREPEVRSGLERVFADECRAQVCLRLNAEDAVRRGLPNLGRLYRAAAESSLQHARILRRVLMGRGDIWTGLSDCPGSERGETDDENCDRIAAADMAQDILAAEALRGVIRAEGVYKGLFAGAVANCEDGRDMDAEGFFVCHSCGYIFTGGESPDHCSQCGAPSERIHEIS